MIEQRIKELSIALSAISKGAVSYDTLDMFSDISKLLKRAIGEAQAAYHDPSKPEIIDDELPF